MEFEFVFVMSWRHTYIYVCIYYLKYLNINEYQANSNHE